MKSTTPGILITNPKRLKRINGDLLPGFSKYFWLKYVAGFDPSQHCARSLLGLHSKRINGRTAFDIPVVLDEAAPSHWEYIYLCGVSTAGWKSNLHVAMVYDPGQRFHTFSYNGLRFNFKHLRPVEIPWIEDGFDGRLRDFTTCRNWQFGVAYYGLEGRPLGGKQGRLL